MGLLFVIEAYTDDKGSFQAVVRRDDEVRTDKRTRYFDGQQGDFVAHVKKLLSVLERKPEKKKEA